jgi:hypothetical protein
MILLTVRIMQCGEHLLIQCQRCPSLPLPARHYTPSRWTQDQRVLASPCSSTRLAINEPLPTSPSSVVQVPLIITCHRASATLPPSAPAPTCKAMATSIIIRHSNSTNLRSIGGHRIPRLHIFKHLNRAYTGSLSASLLPLSQPIHPSSSTHRISRARIANPAHSRHRMCTVVQDLS